MNFRMNLNELMHIVDKWAQVSITSRATNKTKRGKAQDFYNNDSEVLECYIDCLNGLIVVTIK